MSQLTPDSSPALTDPTQRRFRGSAKITDYEVTKEKLGEGTFGIVSKARSKRTGNLFALKKILMHNEKEGFPITALREVKLLKILSHPNILHLEEMAVERHGSSKKGKDGQIRATLYMVMPYMDHDLSGMLTNPDIHFSEGQIKCYLQQLLEGLRYLHDSHILHRDMKAANILISNRGLLQIADFGLARHYEGQTPQAGHGNGVATREYTSLVVTRWYRPPELLLTLKKYTPAIDMWGVGCVFGEMFERKPILEGKTDVDQCVKIFQLVGSPNESSMPGWDELPGCEGKNSWDSSRGDIDKRFGQKIGPKGLDLLKQLLRLDWRTRINAVDALQHEYFSTAPLPARPEDLPRYEDSHELDARRRGHEKQRNLPPAPAGGTVGMGPDEWAEPGQANGYGYGDRAPRGNDRQRGYERDRAPAIQRPYDDRAPRGYDDRRPMLGGEARPPAAWQNNRDRGRPPPTNGHSLPPRPPASEIPARSGPPPAANGRGGAAIDTYIPSYNNDRAPRERNDRDDYDRRRRGSREHAYRDADAPRGQYRDPDAPGRPREPYRDRDDYRRDDRRTRSRSPRDRDGRRIREDDERRERLRERERDMYRR